MVSRITIRKPPAPEDLAPRSLFTVDEFRTAFPEIFQVERPPDFSMELLTRPEEIGIEDAPVPAEGEEQRFTESFLRRFFGFEIAEPVTPVPEPTLQPQAILPPPGLLDQPEPVALEAPPTPAGDLNLLYAEYQRTGGTLSFQDWQLAGTPIRPGAELSVSEAFRTLFPERFLPEASFGFTEEEIPGMVLEQAAQLATDNPADFIRQLIENGRTPEVDTIINAFFDVTPEQIDQLFEELPPPAFTRLTLPIGGVPQETFIDNATGIVYSPEGRRLGTYNPIAREFQTKPVESIVKDFIDTVHFAGRQYWELGENSLLSLMPNFIFQDATEGDRVNWTPAQVQWHNARMREIRQNFRFLYSENKEEYNKWLADNPDLIPDETFQEGAFQHPELLKDPRYYAYELANIIPFILTSTLAAVATGGATIPTILATAAVMTPIEAQSVYEDLINAGAPEGKAAELALVAGGIMGLLEGAGRIPLLKQLSPVLFKRFKGELAKELVKKGTAETIKRFGRTFTVTQFSEVLTEITQEVVGNVAVGFYDKNRGVLENVPDIAVKTAVAMIVPGATGGIVSARPNIRADAENRVKAAIQQTKDSPEAGFARLPGEPEEITPRPEGRVSPDTFEGRSIFDMSPEELDAAASQLAETEKNIASEIFGEEVGARYEQLQRTANSSNVARADAASKEIQRLEDTLTDEQRNRLFGIGEAGANAEELRDLRNALQVVDDSSEQAMGESLRFILVDLPSITDVAQMTNAQKEAVAVLRHANNLAQAKGFDLTNVTNIAIESAARRFEPADAELMLRNVQQLLQRPIPTEEITQEPGAPEAGIQPSMIEGVPAEEVRPAGRSEIIQISMEDQLKLEQARKAELDPEPVPDELQTAFEQQTELEGIKTTLETDPVAIERVRLGNRNVGLDNFISIREQNFPETFTVKQALALFPHGGFETYNQKGTPQFNKVPRDAALDDLATKFGMTADEIANRVMDIRQEKRRLVDLETIVKEAAVETPLPVVPEQTTEEVTQNWETLTKPKFTVKQINALVGFFADYINDPNVLNAWEITRELRAEVRTERGESMKTRTQQLMADENLSSEEAIKQAMTETMRGELPSITTEYLEGMTADLRDALFSKVAHVLKNEPYEMMSTYTALHNALDGKPIPREPGAKGGSAYSRLERVFGDKPKVLKAIDKAAREKKPLDDIVEGVFRETGRDPIPVDQEYAEYLRGLSDQTGGPSSLLGEPADIPNPSDLSVPANLEFAKAELELSEKFSKGELTFEEFELARREARDEAYPLPPVTKYDGPIDNSFKIKPLFNFMEQSMFNRVLKQILWTPLDIGNFLRANKASLDNSFLRQSQLILSGHPVLAYQAHTAAWQSMFSQRHSEAEWELITHDPDLQIYEQIRVDTGHDPLRVPAFAATKGTEQWRTSEEFGFTRQDVERAIPKFTAWLPHIRYSERAFSAGTNKAVWGVWKSKLDFARRYSERIASGEIVLPEGEAFDIIQEMTDEQAMLGDLIQRANLQRFSGLAPAMNAFFFAARSKIGRLLLPKHLLGITTRDGKIGFNPRVMKEAWRDFILWTSYISGIMFLGAWLNLWDLETDPRNAEFMSARIGKIRIDPWAGYRQFVVLYARLVTGTGISSVTGAEYDTDPVRAMQNFVTNSLSPLATILLEFWTGRNFIGQAIDFTKSKFWIEKITPFSATDIWEAYEGEGWRGVAIATLPAVYGEGVQTYTGDWEENFTKLGISKYIDNTGFGLDVPYYDTADFWSDTSSQFKDADPNDLTPSKGFPNYIKAIAEAREINESLSLLPNQPLVSLNADPNLDEPTFSEYHDMWLERQKLVAAGDDAEFTTQELQPDGEFKTVTHKGEEALKEFDKKFKDAEKGNFDQRQFSLLVQYHAFTDKNKQAEFLEEHKLEIGVNPRQDWLRTHPKENAELAIWGQAKVLTEEAYDHFKTLARQYDIPDTAIPELLLPPDTSIDTHFEYLEMVSDGTYAGAEADLLLLKDQIAADEAGVQSYVDWRNETNQPLQLSEKTLENLQLRVDNQQNYDDLEEALARDDEQAVEDIRARKVGDGTFHDVERRVEATGKGTRAAPIPEEIVNDYVSHMQIVDETSGLSAEAKLNRYDNLALNDFLMNEDYWGKSAAKALDPDKFYLDNYLVPRWRIDVAYKEQDVEYKAIDPRAKNPDTGVLLRDEYLLKEENTLYRWDRRRREALETTNSKTGERFPLEEIEKFVNYHELPVKGMRQERYLVENGGQDPENLTGFAAAMHNVKGIDIPNPEMYQEEFETLEGLADNQSEHYIEFPEPGLTLDETREKARNALRFDINGKYTEFGLAELERTAYGKLVPENLVGNYVEYYTIIGEGKPVDYEDINGTSLWYDDDWFLMENIQFYEQVYKGILGNQKRNFTKVPTREVFAKYLEYLQIDSRQAKLRDDFRWDNPSLDDWLVLKFGYTPVTEKRRRAAQTPGEKLALSIADLERRLREHP